MNSNPGNSTHANPEPLNPDPTAKDPDSDAKLRLQLAIFDVTRNAEGKPLDEITESLQSAFAAHGVRTPPGTWLESVASSAFYGKPYIIDFPTAIAADNAVPAPDTNIRDRIAARRRLRQEKLPAGILPSPAAWKVSGNQATHAGKKDDIHPGIASRPANGRMVLAVAVGVVCALKAIRAVRGSQHRSASPVQSHRGAGRRDSNV
ncbi:hypothetical protein [Pseudarthrobacter enclensis]|uniref:hypothetical protein n=1 Tax=Pseudarthrobacter enclensis TaxID=993070 RepID=UPI003EE395C5